MSSAKCVISLWLFGEKKTKAEASLREACIKAGHEKATGPSRDDICLVHCHIVSTQHGTWHEVDVLKICI